MPGTSFLQHPPLLFDNDPMPMSSPDHILNLRLTLTGHISSFFNWSLPPKCLQASQNQHVKIVTSFIHFPTHTQTRGHTHTCTQQRVGNKAELNVFLLLWALSCFQVTQIRDLFWLLPASLLYACLPRSAAGPWPCFLVSSPWRGLAATSVLLPSISAPPALPSAPCLPAVPLVGYTLILNLTAWNFCLLYSLLRQILPSFCGCHSPSDSCLRPLITSLPSTFAFTAHPSARVGFSSSLRV